MRVNIVHPGAGELQYEIRSIVAFAQALEKTGIDITWENIGDPIAKGEAVPVWITDIVADAARDSFSYAYSPTKGMNEAREFLSQARTEETGTELSPENILFFNGLGDAITKTYTWLNPIARVLGPSPAYPTHSSVEGAHGRSRHLTYNLDPQNNWQPDLEDIRNKIQYNPNITALLVINPDNPTGMVYDPEILKEFVKLAKEFNLFIIADEIYANLAYQDAEFVSLASLLDGVPAIVMRGLSKEVPWPGSRCGWLEFYNTDADKAFATYITSLEEAKMIEVCSTTLPQVVLPKILGDSRYQPYIVERTKAYQKRGKQAADTLNQIDGVQVIEPKGAFYLTINFDDHFLQKSRNLSAQNPEAQKLLDQKLSETDESELDKIFCYQLLAHTGICTVPLTSGFNSYRPGLRMTLLESDESVYTHTLDTLQKALYDYVTS
ncbi:pyridoxal phosphate-dependent aminotransferase [Candidatus Saccharibacteria bacterium]|nr:pyridoxal phosphate-dependent aminotransferase [Candidatus Saccharibacteria bacterium]